MALPVSPATAWSLLACPFHALTGLYCPLCGSTHALLALLKGDLVLALRCNILAVAAVMGIAVVAARRVGGARGSRSRFLRGTGWRWVALAVVLIFTVARNLPGIWWLRP